MTGLFQKPPKAPEGPKGAAAYLARLKERGVDLQGKPLNEKDTDKEKRKRIRRR